MLLIVKQLENNNENQPAESDDIMEHFGEGWHRVLLPRNDCKRSDPIVISPDGSKYRSFTQLSKATRYNQRIQTILSSHEEEVKNLFRMVASRSRSEIRKPLPLDKTLMDKIIQTTLAKCRPIHPRIVKLPSTPSDIIITTSKQEDEKNDSHEAAATSTVFLDPPEFDIGKAYNSIETSVVASQNIEIDGEMLIDNCPILTHSDELQAFYDDLGDESEEYPTYSQYLNESCDKFYENEDDNIMEQQEMEHCDHSYSKETSFADMLDISEDLIDDLCMLY